MESKVSERREKSKKNEERAEPGIDSMKRM
jgi:hypothetical protein